MKSNFERIGDHIRLVDERNRDESIKTLLGLTIEKVFIPSVANTIGSDMANYKVIRRGQFACSLMQVRRDKRMPVALLDEIDEAIISQAYPVFQIKDSGRLDPEYLMMWFRRPEFDREACFHAVGGVRGSLEWEDFCNLRLPVPSPEKQREIVVEYETVVKRIALNEKLGRKLEEAAQAIYKHWFVDFEFPMSAEDAKKLGKPELEGKPYRSNGGEMVFCEDYETEKPASWKFQNIKTIIAKKGYIRGPFGSAILKEDMIGEGIPVYEQQHAISDHRDFRYFLSPEKAQSLKRFAVCSGDSIISCSGTLGKISMIRESDPSGIINQALLILRPNPEFISPVLLKFFLSSEYAQQCLLSMSAGSVQTNMAKREIIEMIPILSPDSRTLEILTEILEDLDSHSWKLKQEIRKLKAMMQVLLASIATQ